jgi:hypothetical protein
VLHRTTMAAPPPLWQHEVPMEPDHPADGSQSAPGSLRIAAAGTEEKLSETWRHVKGVARDEVKHYDLMDLVRNARREDTYQFPVPGVRSLLHVHTHALVCACSRALSCAAASCSCMLRRTRAQHDHQDLNLTCILLAIRTSSHTSVLCWDSNRPATAPTAVAHHPVAVVAACHIFGDARAASHGAGQV